MATVIRMRGSAILVALAIWAVPVAAQDASEAAARLAQQAQADAERARRELDRTNAEAQARAAADSARMARDEAERLAAEGRRRADEADLRQQAIAAEYARRRSENEAQSQAAQSDADLARRAAEQRVLAAEEAARRAEDQRRRTEADRPAPRLEVPTGASRRRPAADNRPIAMTEGVVLCRRHRGSQWRCDGPLRVAYGDIDASRTAIASACGADSIRDLGLVSGYRAFGCGFGLNPRSAAPGNRDVPAMLGIAVAGRKTFHCPLATAAYCRSR